MRMKRNGNYYQKKIRSRPISFDINENGCFIVTSHEAQKNGYIEINVRGKRTYIHRYVFEECFGFIPDGMMVRHKCDNRQCINPEHMELGTHEDNMRDMVERGRSKRGPRQAPKILSIDEVKEIKFLLSIGAKNIDLAKKYNVHTETISFIKRGVTWKNVTFNKNEFFGKQFDIRQIN
jgi:hypothetical protein